MLLRALVPASLLGLAAAQVNCDPSAKCTFTTDYKGNSVTLDFRRLCNAGGDYVLSDSIGHTYYAQICGYASKGCLPADWENQYEYGRVIQTWGGVPTCNRTAPECVEERTGAPTCCTEPCQVVAVRSPTLVPLVPGDPTQGVELLYAGETPTESDPYQCDINPATGTPFSRVTHMQFFCDPTLNGFAQLYEVDQNSTDDCDYTLKFKTDVVCAPALTGMPAVSGGWIFNIIVMTVAGVYIIGGYSWNYYKTRTLKFPNAGFWAEVDALIWDGVRFLCNRCRPAGRTQLKETTSGSVAPAFTSSASTAGSSSAKNYQAVGGSTTSSYTDL